MGGFGPLAASLGFFLRGQQQGQQANQLEALKAQILRRQALAATKQILQMPDGTFKIVDLADPSVAGSTVGTPENFGAHIQSLLDSGALKSDTDLTAAAQQAIKTNDPLLQQDIYKRIVGRIGTRASGGNVPLSADQKRQAIVEALKANPPAELRPLLQRAVAPDASPALLDLAFKELTPAFGSSLYAPHYFATTGVDPNSGLPITTPYRSEGRSGVAAPVVSGASPSDPSTGSAGLRPLSSTKMNPTDQKLIGTVQALLPQLDDLKAKLQAIGPERWNRNLMSRSLGYAKQKYGKEAASSDPEIAKLTSKLIQVEATANAALAASAGTRAYGFIQHSEGHIPSGRGDFDYNMNAIDTLRDPNGPYLPTLRLYGINPASASSADPTGKPVAGGISLPSDAIPLGGGRYYSPSTTKSYEVRP